MSIITIILSIVAVLLTLWVVAIVVSFVFSVRIFRSVEKHLDDESWRTDTKPLPPHWDRWLDD